MKTSWYLQGFVSEDREVWKTPLRRNRFLIGRGSQVDLALSGGTVSTRHALIVRREEGLVVRDLGSKNGTFVNDVRVGEEALLYEGDILRFSDWEFRLLAENDNSSPGSTMTLDIDSLNLRSVRGEPELDAEEVLRPGSFFTVLQPVVRISDREILGYEVLGRGSPVEDPRSALEIFDRAERVGAQAELSERLRSLGVLDADRLPGRPWLFLNTHPEELFGGNDELIHSMAELRGAHLESDLVLEIHEAAVTDLEGLCELRKKLGELDIDLAFDDFGTGQARLLELAEATPRFVKFDRAWIAELDQATESRVELVSTLVRMVRTLGIDPIAEGVETEAESRAVSAVGFDYGQGYFFGRPGPLEQP